MDRKRLTLFVMPHSCDLDEDIGPELRRDWAAIYYASPNMTSAVELIGTARERAKDGKNEARWSFDEVASMSLPPTESPDIILGVTPIMVERNHIKRPLLFEDLDSVYGEGAKGRFCCSLSDFGYVRIYRERGATGRVDLYDEDTIRNQFRIERDLSYVSPEDCVSFLVRIGVDAKGVEATEVYPEYYGIDWKSHIWSGYRNVYLYFCRSSKRYMLGDTVYYDYYLYSANFVVGVARILMSSGE